MFVFKACFKRRDFDWSQFLMDLITINNNQLPLRRDETRKQEVLAAPEKAQKPLKKKTGSDF